MAVAALAVNGTATAAPAHKAQTAAAFSRATGGSSHTPLATRASVKSPTYSTFYGCPVGDVCIYDHDNQPPSASDHHTNYYNYGTYNFSNITGWHDVVNNQTGGAEVSFCYGYNGTNCPWSVAPDTFIVAQQWDHIYFTPVDSMQLCRGYKNC
ncbi:MAG: hypothetical protein ABIP57_02280 [Jatrophihabitantaceae bacterium]